MNKLTISATELKNNTADILNRVFYENIIVEVERHGKPIVEIRPKEAKSRKRKSLKKTLEKFFGLIPNFPEVYKERSTLKRKVEL